MSKEGNSAEREAPDGSGDAGAQVDFGFRRVAADEKPRLVREVFDTVAARYDLMNDLMSGGIHRLWKEALIDWMAPQPHQRLVDLAGGTGDISLRFLRAGGGSALVTDVNESMLAQGRSRRAMRAFAGRMSWSVGDAERLPLAEGCAHLASIAFGLRNVTDREAAIAEAHRILKPGGRFLCLEFSHVENDLLRRAYDAWSFQVLPRLGRVVVGDSESYRYLAESIRTFPEPEVLADMFAGAGFAQVRLRRLSGGIACIHSGWKLD